MNRLDLSRLSSVVATLTILALVSWAAGLPTWIHSARAASLISVSDTLGDSDLNTATTHAFAFTTVGALDDSGGADTIVITFDPTGSNFTVGINSAADFTNETGIDVVDTCGGGSNEFTLATTSETITLTICAGDSVPASTAIAFTIANNQITNPNSAQSYVVRIETKDQGTSVIDTADTRVTIIDDVVVTASVDTTFTFTVSGVAIGSTVNGDATTTATTTTATTLPFGTLASGTPKVLAQDLSVSTNAKNGFVVTIEGDGALESSTGADIDQFKDGSVLATPAPWTLPAANLDDENTWGHFGITSEDSDLNGDEFGVAQYAGDFATSTRQVFSHTGAVDGVTPDKGATRIGFKIEITDMQEAGTDYTNTLTYVATPTF